MENELTEEALLLAKSYIPDAVAYKYRDTDELTDHMIIVWRSKRLIGNFGKDKDIAVFDGDIVQIGNKKYSADDGEYYQMRWNGEKYWWYAHIIQSKNHPHRVGIKSFETGVSITSGKPYSFTGIYRVVNI